MRGSYAARIMRKWWEAATAHRLPAWGPLPSPAQYTCARSAAVSSVSLCRYVVRCRQVSSDVVMCRYVVTWPCAVVSLCRHVSSCCPAVVSLCRYVVTCRYVSLCRQRRQCRYVVMSSPSTCSPVLPAPKIWQMGWQSNAHRLSSNSNPPSMLMPRERVRFQTRISRKESCRHLALPYWTLIGRLIE